MNAFLWALLAALIWGITSVIEKLVLIKTEALPGLFYRCVGVLAGILCLILFMVKPADIRNVEPRSGFLLAVAGFLGSFVAFIAFYKGLKLGEMSIVVPVAGSFYLMAFILGIIVLGESFTLIKLLGVTLITAGVWLLGAGVFGK